MDIVKQWERIREQCDKQKTAVILIYSLNNPYGFKLNINHPAIGRKWEDFQKSKGITRYSPFRDDYRREFEEQMLKSEYFKKLAMKEAQHLGAAYEYVMMHGSLPDKQEDIA